MKVDNRHIYQLNIWTHQVSNPSIFQPWGNTKFDVFSRFNSQTTPVQVHFRLYHLRHSLTELTVSPTLQNLNAKPNRGLLCDENDRKI